MQLYGQVEQLSFTSEALRDNRLGDPHEREVTVYLPPAYDGARTERYPSLYLLAAHGSTGAAFLNWKPWQPNTLQMLDAAIHAGEIPPVILVMPDCWTKLGGSQYLDSAMGKYETYLVQEVVPFVDDHYRTRASRDHRGVLGFSSGGYGALVQGMRNPQTFGALACHSGDIYWEFTCLPKLAELHQALQKYGGVASFLNNVNDIQPKNGPFWTTVMTLCWAMAHGTNPDSFLGFDLPIHLDSGALNRTVWQRWLRFDPLRMAEQPGYLEALRSLRLLFVDVGAADEYQLQVGARLLSQRLTAEGVQHLFEEHAGRHTSADVRFDRSVGLLARALQ
ncbi:MAG: esterase [Anaerolineae bacterium]|nr:esterase [Anaerolineae bacterium]